MLHFLHAYKQALLKEELEENARHLSASSCIQPPGLTSETASPERRTFRTVLADLADDRGLTRQKRGVSRGTPSVRPSQGLPHRDFHATVHTNVDLFRNNEFCVQSPCKICGNPGKTCLLCKTAMCDQCYSDKNYDSEVQMSFAAAC